ncbi:MAG: hypothetical protein EKK37_06260 [Sphingobacteriales bacterium]|nr:MAG: hypothetical protein EKK37_06260 [Sphingobacteriales bacterium]
MKKTLLLLCFIAHLTTAFSQQTDIPPKADTLYNHLMTAARPAIKNWVSITAAKYKGKEVTKEQAIADVKQSYNALGNLNDADIEAIAFLVMMQAAKSAQQDLKDIMGQVKKINDAKASQRQKTNELKQSSAQMKTQARAGYQNADSLKPLRAATVAKQVSEQKDKKDNMADLSEEQQLKLQMIMDRRSKAIQAISNMMKKLSETEENIIKNIK